MPATKGIWLNVVGYKTVDKWNLAAINNSHCGIGSMRLLKKGLCPALNGRNEHDHCISAEARLVSVFLSTSYSRCRWQEAHLQPAFNSCEAWGT